VSVLGRADFPLPDTDWEPTREFWAAAAREELAIPRCQGCRRLHWYPEPRCRRCGVEKHVWERMSGRGTLFTWVVLRHAFLPHFRADLPFVSGLVALEDDPSIRVATRIVDCPPERLAVEMPVEVVFRPLAFPGIERTVTAPFFRPSAQA
jgi:uncharacterized OB-fold protein